MIFINHINYIVWCIMIYVPISLMLYVNVVLLCSCHKEFCNAHPFVVHFFIFGELGSSNETNNSKLINVLKILSICFQSVFLF